jgi:hypothetical protein
MTQTQRRILALESRGFDQSYIVRGGLIRVRCSQCAAATINGIACHETGCPNAVHECHGCNALVPIRVKYCADCL